MFKKKYRTQEKKSITLLALSQRTQQKIRAPKNINTMEQKLKMLKDKISQKKLETAAKNITKSTDIKDKTQNFLSASKASPQKQLFLKNKHPAYEAFVEFLSELKMSPYAPVFLEKNISTKEQILALSKDKINQMTNIPIGYRIKLIKKIHDNQKLKQSSLQVCQEEYEIQKIIKKRKEINKFEPLPVKEQNEKNTESRENNIDCFDDQEVQILDEIATFFSWKKNCQEEENQKCQSSKEEEKKYCWECFNCFGNRSQSSRFCCSKCQSSFNSKTIIDQKMLQANQEAEIQWEQNKLIENRDIAEESGDQDDFDVDLTIV